jgi:N-acetyl-anhydromuramyl-L-alanine amidase AmpD
MSLMELFDTMVEMADEFMKDGSQSSAHYLVGQIEGDPEIASEKPNALLNNSGFLQFVQLDQDAYYASGVEYNDEAANKNAVSIVLVASENPLSTIGSYSTYQKSMVKKLIAHIRAEAKDDTIPVINASDLDGRPSLPKMTVSFE